MRTIYYVDGYNLYFGALKHTPYKWLDLPRLLHEEIGTIQDPSARLVQVKYFTADVLARLASHGQAAQHAQHAYIRALQSCYPDQIEVIRGYYSLQKADAPRFRQPPDKRDRVDIWRLEEKQTDVNIAIAAYRDVVRGRAEQVVFVSNDSDLVPVLQAIREDFAGMRIGVIIPTRKPNGELARRPGNKRLSKLADWTRHHIREEELAACLLPDQVPTRKKPIRKPDYW